MKAWWHGSQASVFRCKTGCSPLLQKHAGNSDRPGQRQKGPMRKDTRLLVENCLEQFPSLPHLKSTLTCKVESASWFRETLALLKQH